ncbi:uncharacterized protein EV154DRAFT_424999 [Mucor mucedo]|uniref:uncharacterized protein n=1 Tax=Mucor mucedo TaxID=29922 RepID=UPI00221E8B1B|nr:uncharacterized protein EV154DRAFT_424999 [Mucor mucedo]KAI7888806.1 hypothetical protein EV154DRAFT_424999 [Mucor mucedo]
MYSTNSSRNPWGNSFERFSGNNSLTSIDELKKSIREQKILLATTGQDSVEEYSEHQGLDVSIEELKRRIISLNQEMYDKQQMAASAGRSTLSPAQWWERYELNMRQLEDIADQRRALLKEIDYLVGTNMKNLEEELIQETEKLNTAKSKASQLKKSVYTPSSINYDQPGMTESERIRAKAQAMVAARLGRSSSSNTSLQHDNAESESARQRMYQVTQFIGEIKQIRREVESIVEANLSEVDQDLVLGAKQLKDRQMFEQGLYIDDELARFIDTLERSLVTNSHKRSYLPTQKMPLLPPLPLSSIPPYSQPPPPIPTSQRPGTPRSAADIKAEAHKRIEQRKLLFVKDSSKTQSTVSAEDPCRLTEDIYVSGEEIAAQERMRQAEADARARLDAMREKRHKLRKEAAEAEEKKKRAAAEATAAAEAEMLAEKKVKQQEEDDRMARTEKAHGKLAEQQRVLREAEFERLRLEREEKSRLEAEKLKKREEEERIAEEIRQNEARKAAEQAAQEKRLRRMEIERREREIEAARLEELKRRKQWEEEENQKRLEEERRIKAKEEEAARIRKQLDEEDERLEQQRKREKEKRLKEEAESLVREEEERILKQKQQEEKALYEAGVEDIEAETSQIDSMYYSSPASSLLATQNSTTAGTSGYGIDVEDEVNFTIIYRVKTLYEYQGVREDDLSFSANETLKAHPSKDKGSDWWYGTSLSTNQVGFFPRTYVEVIEEADEVIIVQPFQDENSDWWYGTSEDTEESGYFPKTYVEKINSVSKNNQISPSATSMSISISGGQSSQNNSHSAGVFLTVSDHDLPRGLSAPNTPIMKKVNLGVDKAQLSKRRRAASTVSSTNQNNIGSPQLIFPRSGSVSENLELLTWASTMDPLELEAIPPEERKRQEAIFELIATEKTYLNDLQMIINIFYADSGKYLTQDERDVVFSNIDDLLICNTALLSDMENRQNEKANVADSLQCYSTYCRNQSYATKFLQKKREDDQWFEVFLKTAQTRAECRSLDLSHFLLEPVQRITRYPLLLRQILNNTPKKHPDHSLVRSALSIAQKVLEDVNEETRRFENIQKMSELSRILDLEGTVNLNVPGREFVMDGALFKAKSGRKLHGFLFNDLLILAEPLKSLSPKGYLYSLYREPMPIESVSVRQQQTMTLKPSFGGNNNTDDLSFQIVSGSHVIAVKTSSASQKRQWMNQIQHFSALQQYR